ncbi:MAG: hypothetical protein EON91_10825 [Brevundimonas sp.]|uniref:hypothetical protein n=1 Tax=Brevundimonas sp. TaxID=1871086 RepID=UPI00120021AB|nr:hypothetical protein [Brevundimonas sp.]RZJ17047.1 MAG: hypothetical protein EON91_10825 [Brevundimonas sp.]
MSPLIMLYPSDRTPSPDAFAAAARDVVSDCDAAWLGEEGDYDLRLNDGTEIVFDILESESGAYLQLDEAREAAIDLTYAVAERTACFVSINTMGQGGSISSGTAPTCALPSTGAVLAENEGGHAAPVLVADRAAFGDWFRVVMIEIARDRPVSLPPRPKRSLFQRLSDALFGKEM